MRTKAIHPIVKAFLMCVVSFVAIAAFFALFGDWVKEKTGYWLILRAYIFGPFVWPAVYLGLVYGKLGRSGKSE
jgi:hypothetical protein|tara:strand:- start:982 stop:1203 length:222 start_codon:yes stop_codon:yes gene_type:complete